MVAPGVRVGGYEIVAPLGAGGMGEVWQARDTRLDRAVALKLLPEEFTRDPDRMARFEREAKVLASLNHPNIAAIYGLEAHGDQHVLIMELVAGEDLSDRLKRGPLPVSDALDVASQIGEALAEGHAKGIVHRDLKPANVRVSRDGRIKVLDYGLAKTLPRAAASDPGLLSQAPTLASPSSHGTILGTAAYMSPEQARGQPVDEQADIWAFGVVLFEMLSGRRPFRGGTVTDTLAEILMKDPDWTELPFGTPEPVQRLLRRCLERDAKRRLHSIADARIELREATTPSTGSGRGWSLAAGGRHGKHLVASAVLALVALASAWALRSWRGPGELQTGRMTRVTTAPGLEIDPALSPDGHILAYAAGPPGDMRIHVQQVSGGQVIPIAAELADNQACPQWSPDGTRIAFHAGATDRTGGGQAPSAGTLFAVPALGGTPRRLLEGPDSPSSSFSPTWSPDGARIAFASGFGIYGKAISIAELTGAGTSRRVAEGVDLHSLRFSRDGTRIAYVSGNPSFTLGGAHLGNDARSSILVLDVGTGKTQRITSGEWLDASPVWTADDRALLFVSNREGSRDVYRLRIGRSSEAEGAPERLTSGLSAHGLDLSADGRTLAYSVYTPRAHVWSVPLPRTGTASLSTATALTSGSERVEALALSADGRWIAYDSDRSGNSEIWRIPAGGGPPVQLTTHPSGDYVGDWSPDGQEIAFHSFRSGNRDIYVMAADGSAVQPVTSTPDAEGNAEWSPDGNQLAFQAVASGRPKELVVASRTRHGAAWGVPRPLGVAGSDPSWSPDGRLIAYFADRALRLISPSGENDHVLVDGRDPATNLEPRFAYWSKDARTLYYKAYNDRQQSSIWSIPVEGGTPRLLIRFDDPSRPSSRLEFATDDRVLYFTITEHESDIWVMELRPK